MTGCVKPTGRESGGNHLSERRRLHTQILLRRRSGRGCERDAPPPLGRRGAHERVELHGPLQGGAASHRAGESLLEPGRKKTRRAPAAVSDRGRVVVTELPASARYPFFLSVLSFRPLILQYTD